MGAQTVLSGAFPMPPEGYISAALVASTEGFQVGVKVAVESAGVLLIEVVSSPPAAMFLKNLGGSGNAPGSTIIPAGSKVSVVE